MRGPATVIKLCHCVGSSRTRRRLIAEAQTGTKYGGGRNKYFHRPNSALSTPTCKLVELEVHNTLDKLHEAYHHSQTSRLNHLPDETPLNSSYIQRPKNSYKCPSTSVNTFVQLPYRDIRINTLVRKAINPLETNETNVDNYKLFISARQESSAMI